MAAAVFGEPLPFDAEAPMFDDYAEPAPVARMPVRVQQRRGRPSNSIADAISGFLNN
jgi:hypothetical protein